MGVITQKGVVGIVQSSSKNYSIVISLLHNKTSIGIKLKKIIILYTEMERLQL